jgi:hypothetical protein
MLALYHNFDTGVGTIVWQENRILCMYLGPGGQGAVFLPAGLSSLERIHDCQDFLNTADAFTSLTFLQGLACGANHKPLQVPD